MGGESKGGSLVNNKNPRLSRRIELELGLPQEKGTIEEYVPKEKEMMEEYVIVITKSAGVFAGNLKDRSGEEVVLQNTRRLWYWDGADSLYQLAMEGTSKPRYCKFLCEVDEITLTEAIEVIKCTEKAYESIKEVKVWSA